MVTGPRKSKTEWDFIWLNKTCILAGKQRWFNLESTLIQRHDVESTDSMLNLRYVFICKQRIV